MPTLKKPMVRAVLFVTGENGCALIDGSESDAEYEPIRSYGAYKSREWYEAAFSACTLAYRRLQSRHRDKDVVCTLDSPPSRSSAKGR